MSKSTEKLKIIDVSTYDRLQQNNATITNIQPTSILRIKNGKYKRMFIHFNLLQYIKGSKKERTAKYTYRSGRKFTKEYRKYRNYITRNGKQREMGRKKRTKLKSTILTFRQLKQKQRQQTKEFGGNFKKIYRSSKEHLHELTINCESNKTRFEHFPKITTEGLNDTVQEQKCSLNLPVHISEQQHLKELHEIEQKLQVVNITEKSSERQVIELVDDLQKGIQAVKISDNSGQQQTPDFEGDSSDLLTELETNQMQSRISVPSKSKAESIYTFQNEIQLNNVNISTNEVYTCGPNAISRQLHSRRFREYCDNCVTPRLKVLTEHLLRELDRFQRRAYDQNKIKGRAHKRFVVGFREVNKSLNIKKIKLVIIATDCEACEGEDGLDQLVDNIKATCKDQQIPLAFALLRRQIAYALHKKACISCVGILDYDGLQESFGELVATLNDARTTYYNLTKI